MKCQRLVCLWLFAFVAPCAVAADAFVPAATIIDVDLDASQVFNDGKPKPVNAKALKATLDPAANPSAFTAGGPPNWKMKRFDYLIAFARPIAVGTLLAKTSYQYTKGTTFRALTPDAIFPGNPTKESDWVRLDADREDGDYTIIFPPGFKTRAILCTENRWLGPSRLSKLVLLKMRLHSITPHCLGQGEMASGAWDPMNVPRDDTWHNAGTIGESKDILRRPVTSIEPSWFIMTREDGIEPLAMQLRSNITDYKLYALNDTTDVSPALAANEEWRRVAHKVLRATKFNPKGGSNVRILTMSGVRSRAFKLLLREVNPRGSKVAAINEWTIWEDLGDREIPPLPKDAAPPPVLLDYEIGQDAEVAVVVDDMQGIRQRNLIAQVSREAGPNKVAWNLKDEDGRYVSVGTYRMKGIYAPPLELHYQHTFYPSVEMHSPASRPWPGGVQDGWLANHANHTAVAAVRDRLYISAGGTEGGHAIIETDFSGQKKWGGRWGADKLFTDGKTLFIVAGGRILRFDAKAHRATHIITPKNESRRGNIVGMAAHDNRVHLAFHGPFPYFDRVLNAGHVDLAACLPRLPEKSNPKTRTYYNIPAYPQGDFLRLLRLAGTPAGLDAAGSLTYIPSTDFSSPRNFVVVAFKKPMPIGGVMFPALTHDDYTLHLSVLKPDADYPPNPRREADWIPFAVHHETAWEVLPAPPNTVTRALRLSFTKSDADGLGDFESDDSMDPGGELTGLDGLEGGGDSALDSLLGKETWTAQLEGLQIMRRRFKNLFTTAKIKVNSGEVDEATGEWHAQREKYIWPDNPGVYILEWDKPQKVCGLGIKEIDGMKTFVDVYVGPDNKAIDTSVIDEIYDYTTGKDWKCVGLYRQKVRSGSMPSANRNVLARYLDGFLNFGREYETRAIRIRVSEQWPKRALRRKDQGGGAIDARRCNIYGAAPLQYIGGEPPSGDDALTMKRLSIYDGTSGKVIREMPSDIKGPIAFTPDGRLHAIHARAVVEVDRDSGTAKPGRVVVPAKSVKAPRLLTIDHHGNFYVYDDGRGVRVVRRYSPDGTFLNLIGDPGPKTAGPWNPGRFGEIVSMSADKQDGLWLIYPHENPRRTIHFKTDGTFVKEMLGNTQYGGGGVLDPYDKTRAYFKDVVFEIDWGDAPTDKASSRVHSLRSEKFWEASPWGGWRPMMTVKMVDGRKYFVSTPLSHQFAQFQGAGFVYIYDEETQTMRFCAGVGAGSAGGHFSSGRMLDVLNGRDPASLKFIWGDLNGNGEMDPDEVQVTPRTNPTLSFGDFDSDLGIMGGTLRYEVKKYLADGTPIYHEVPVTAPGGLYRLDNGNYWSPGARGAGVGYNMVNQVHTPDGRRLWTYWSTFDVSGLYIAPWSPGRVDNQFSLIGHATEQAGDLGEFMVFHANNGQWNVWTVDGLLASHVTLHAGDPRRRYLGKEYHRGARLDGITAGQEHFHGFFTKIHEDNTYKIVIGGNHATIVEVKGFDKFKRFQNEFTVTREMMEATRAWEAKRLQRSIYTRTPTVISNRRTPSARFGQDLEHIDRHGLRASFQMAYSKDALFAHWTASGTGPFRNSPDDFQRVFKTGSAVDLMLGTDPQADPKRRRPVAGDIRLVLSVVNGEPKAVLYRPVAPNAAANEAWDTTTKAGGTARFDQVIELSNINMRWSDTGNGLDVSATIPLKAIGLKIKEDQNLKMDWGVLSTSEGNRTTARDYWVNKMAVGTGDEPTEARLHPDRWGYVKFVGAYKSQVEKLMDGEDGEDLKKQDLDDILDGALDDI